MVWKYIEVYVGSIGCRMAIAVLKVYRLGIVVVLRALLRLER